ncbi:MAG: SCO family protein [Chloroflexota bacterium]
MRNKLFIAILVLIFLSACGAATPAPISSGGVNIDPPRTINDGTFINQFGKTAHLSDLHGKTVLMFFGYTNCPDVCPITLSDFTRIKLSLGKLADKVAFVFVSVDPTRDTPEVLTRYLAAFDKSFIGLTPDDATLQQMTKDFQIVFSKADTGLIGHSTESYVLDAQGRLRTVYPVGTLPDPMAADIRTMLSSGG